MRFVKVLFSLFSVQLIVISALLMTYLAVTATNKIQAVHRSTPIAEEESARVAVADTESLDGTKGIKEVSSQPTATGIILEAREGLTTAPVSGQVISISNAEIVSESWVNESGSRANQLLSTDEPPCVNGEDGAMP